MTFTRWSETSVTDYSSDLTELFNNPPDEFRPVPWLCYTGSCANNVVKDAIDKIFDKGIRSFFIFPIYGLEVEYLSDAWFDLVKTSVEYAKNKAMTV